MPLDPRPRPRHLKIELRWRLATIAGLCALFVPVSLRRYVDGDEGYLLYAARLIVEGKQLYRDFFFPQAPLVPNVFAWLYRITGPGWWSARLMAAAFAALSGYLVYELARRYTRAPRWGMVAALLYAACGYSIGWLPIAKTYGLAVLCSLAACVVLERGSRYAYVLGGLLIVLAAGARLYLCVIGLNAIIFGLRRERTLRARALAVGMLGCGAILGLCFFVPPFLRDFETAYFGVFEFATMRFPEQTTLFGSWSQKLGILLAELSFEEADGTGSTQLLGLVVLGLVALFARPAAPNRLTMGIWPLLLFVSLLPFNTFTQYACVVVPFVAVEAAVALSMFVPQRAFARAMLPSLTVYTLLGAFDLHRFAYTGAAVIGVAPTPQNWRIEQIIEVGKQIDTYQVDEAVSFWPGYFLSTRTHIIAQLTNHFAFHVTGRLSERRRQKLVLMSEQELAAAMLQARFPLVVVGNWVLANWNDTLSVKYKLDRSVGNAQFWIPR